MTAHASSGARVAAVVRVKDEAEHLSVALRSLRMQSVPVEIVVVDSGSTDGSLEIARSEADRVVTLAAEDFTYGGSLNLGFGATAREIVVILSAHCRLPDPEWVARAVRHYDDPKVGGAWGCHYGADGRALEAAIRVEPQDITLDPYWGFSNHASSCRRSIWRNLPFDETVRACEDKLWMWRTIGAGHSVVADPDLFVSVAHRRRQGARALWRREVAEHSELAAAIRFPVPTARREIDRWWNEFPGNSSRPTWLRRVSPYRFIEMAAGLYGDRRGLARRGPSTLELPGVPSDRGGPPS